MKPSDLFGVVVRSLGLLTMLSLWILFWVAITLLFRERALVAVMIGAVPLLFVGIWLLGGAPGLVSIAYPEESEKGDNQR